MSQDGENQSGHERHRASDQPTGGPGRLLGSKMRANNPTKTVSFQIPRKSKEQRVTADGQEEGHSPVTEQSMPYSDHHPPAAQTEGFCPPLDQLVPDSSLSSLSSSDGVGVAGAAGAPLDPNFEALRMAISQFKADKMARSKEQRALFQYVSSESREFEDILTILSSNYRDAASDGTFVYTCLRLVHSEPMEKDFVEKRKEMKQDGRTEKELEEAHCFLLCDTAKLLSTCEEGLLVGHSWITALGNPNKGVYLSNYSDLLQINPFNPGVTGEIVIFKVIKGRVKSIYENMSKNLLNPTPKFDSHFSKNASKVTSLTSFKSYELTQQYFYEYSFDELRPRPRHVCPVAVVSFQFKSKDALLQTKPLAPLRSYSQTSEGSKGRSSYVVWSGDLVSGGRVHYQVCLQSFSSHLPFKLPEKLDLSWTMALDEVVQKMPSALFSWNLYAGSHEVLKNGLYCSLLEVVEKAKSGDNLAALLGDLETHKVVLVYPLTDRCFLFLLSSVQMATPIGRGPGWKRCLQALFVFPESRDVTKYTSRCPASQDPLPSESLDSVMPWLDSFVPALHHALVKVACNPPADISAGVERQALAYLSGLKDNKVRPFPMTEYDAKLDDREKLFPKPKQHKLNMDGYLRSYYYSPTIYLVPVAKAKELVEAHCSLPDSASSLSDPESPEKPAPEVPKPNGGPQPPEVPPCPASEPQRVQQLLNLVQDVRGWKRKRKMEQEAAEKILKYQKKASQERGEFRPAEEGQSPSSLSAVRDERPGRGEERPGRGEERPGRGEEALRFKLGLPTNCDIDLRKRTSEEEKKLQEKRDYLEEQTAGSMSSLEGFSPSSHSELPRASASQGDEDDREIPWVLIPISGLRSEKYRQREKDNPHDPRFIQVPMATRTEEGVTSVTADGQEEGHSPVTEQSMPYSDHHPPAPQTEGFCPPLDQLVPDSSLSSLSSSDGVGVAGAAGAPLDPNFEALRMLISQFKADKMARSKLEPEGGQPPPPTPTHTHTTRVRRSV